MVVSGRWSPFIGGSCFALTLISLISLSLFPTLRGEGLLRPGRIRTIDGDSRDCDRKAKRGRAGSAWNLSSRQVIHIPEYVKNYGYGRRIEDNKNMPIYFTHATLASLVLTILSKWWDPTYTITAMNALIWLGWQMAHEDDLLLSFMHDNFLLHRDPSKRFKPRQVLLHGFSHIGDAHVSANLGCLLSIGPLIRKYTKWSAFSYASFYVASLYVSSLFNEVVYIPLMNKYGPKSKKSFFRRFVPKQSASLGASGAVSAVITFCGLTCPNEKFCYVEEDDQSSGEESKAAPLWIVALSAFLSDIILPLTAEGETSNISHGAHIGGSVFGATIFIFNRLWGAKLNRLLLKSTSCVKNLIPKPIRNISRRLRQLYCKAKARLDRISRRVYARLCALPWEEMFGIVVTVIALAIAVVEENVEDTE